AIGEEAAIETAAAAVRYGARDVVARTHLNRLADIVEREVLRVQVRTAQGPFHSVRRPDENRFAALTRNAFDLVCEVDAQGCFLYVSPNYESVLGVNLRELVGTSIFDRVHPDDLERARQEFSLSVFRGAGLVEYRYRHGNGEWRWFES